MKAKFRIENIYSAASALRPGCTFSDQGGTIGSAADSTWCIQDIVGQIPATAAQVAVIDQRFTLAALGSAQIRLNGANSSVPIGRPVVLNDNDTIAVGELRLTVHLSDTLAAPEGRGLNGLVEPRNAKGDGLVIDGEFAESIPVYSSAKPVVDDPLAALDKATAGSSVQGGSANRAEPLETFGNLHAPINPRPSEAVGTQESDSRVEVNSAVSFQKAPSFLFDAEQDDFDDELVDHVAIKPLAQALGLPSRDLESLESDLVLSEVGAALRTAIDGLVKLFASHTGSESRFPLATMHLHVVEDNPLRFAANGQEATEALFARRGTVHLSASAAIAESLENLGRHQDATEAATDHALTAVLNALKPAALERRFAAYSRSSGAASGPQHDAWCWQMYKAYLEELSSHKQEGLRMLFWEIFACEYQAIMRSLAHGSGKFPTAGAEE